MLWTALFIPTLRENPADAEAISHALLLRAGYIRQLAAGVYSHLTLAQRSFAKIQAIVREEMNAIGAQEMLLPALQPSEVWRESGRWDSMGDNLFRLRDRFGRSLCLGMTHEEVVTALARGELRSYKQLPQIWYQIQTKFRDEPRPKGGLLRMRQFLMKDSYSFDLTPEGLDASYEKHRLAYHRIFGRCGLDFLAVEAHSGAMGGSVSQEFMAPCEAGEDTVVRCPGCGYCANLEKASGVPVPPALPDPEDDLQPEPFHTPGRKTIAEVAEFTGLPETSQMKSLVMSADGSALLVLVRGDHQLSETKLQSVTGAAEIRAAFPEEIRNWFGADPGSLGPIGVRNMRVIADEALRGRRNMICGANKDDYHLRHVTPGEDFQAEFAELRSVAEGDTCMACGAEMALVTALELGHIFKLGYRYSTAMGLHVSDESGHEAAPAMGSYGIGIERILAAVVEQSHDADGMILPPAVAPFLAVLTPVNYAGSAEQREAAHRIYDTCRAASLDVLLDDRDERPGVKFKDADLIGVPFRVNVGRKLAQGLVEVVERRGRKLHDVPVSEVAAFIQGAAR